MSACSGQERLKLQSEEIKLQIAILVVSLSLQISCDSFCLALPIELYIALYWIMYLHDRNNYKKKECVSAKVVGNDREIYLSSFNVCVCHIEVFSDFTSYVPSSNYVSILTV